MRSNVCVNHCTVHLELECRLDTRSAHRHHLDTSSPNSGNLAYGRNNVSLASPRAVSLADYPPVGGQGCGRFANNTGCAAPAGGRLTTGPGDVDRPRR
jgi:hypothetical protein